MAYQRANSTQFKLKNGQALSSLPAYMKRQLKLDQVQGIGNKEQKAHAFLQKEMGDCKDLPLDEELYPGDAGVNFHASPELD